MLLCCLVTSSARADLPRPPKPTPKLNEPQLQISTNNDGKAHLRIPRSMLSSLANQTAPARSDSGISPAHTVVAGIALSAALAASGLLFVRRRNGQGRMLLLIAGLGGVGLIATIASANAPPFGHVGPPAHPAPSAITMPVMIDVVDDANMQLTIPASKAALLAPPTTKPSSAEK